MGNDVEHEGRKPDRLPRHPPAILLLMALCLAAFAGATALVVISGDDVAGRVRYVVFAATSFFVLALLVGVVWRTRRAAAAAAVVAVLACGGAVFAAVEANRQYDQLKERFLAGRPGPVVTRLPMYQGQQLGRNMLTSIAAWVATITGTPLAVYFLVRAARDPASSDDDDR